MRDLAEGRVSIGQAQAQANVAGKLIRLVELRLRYGQWIEDLGSRDLELFAQEVQRTLGVPGDGPAGGGPAANGADEPPG